MQIVATIARKEHEMDFMSLERLSCGQERTRNISTGLTEKKYTATFCK